MQSSSKRKLGKKSGLSQPLIGLVIDRNLQASNRRDSLRIVHSILPSIHVVASLVRRGVTRSRIVDLEHPLSAAVLEPERRLAPHHLEPGTELHEVDA